MPGVLLLCPACAGRLSPRVESLQRCSFFMTHRARPARSIACRGFLAKCVSGSIPRACQKLGVEEMLDRLSGSIRILSSSLDSRQICQAPVAYVFSQDTVL